MSREQTIGSERIYQGRVLALRVDIVRMPDGRERRREIVEHPGAVAIVAVDPEERILMVRQYRSGPAREMLEVPAGTREAGEAAEECVRRELQEETGYRAATVRPLLGFYTAPGFCTEYLEVYVAADLTPSRLTGDDDEDIALERVPLARVPELIRTGEICDAKSVAGLLAYLAGRAGD